ARPIVVELFTSQGCSSCPPADALLGKLSQRQDVVALTFPITYWDMLGWKDTLATDANTRRQKGYAQAMNHGGVYTPQMIIDGVNDVVGGREKAVLAAIQARRDFILNLQKQQLRQSLANRQIPLDVPVVLTATPREVHIVVGQAHDSANHDATIWMMRVLSQGTVKIGGGENQGRTITYRNVVRDLKAVGMWKGQAVTLSLPRGDTQVPHDGIAIVVQQGGFGRIIGASMISHSNYYAAQ
ncbi:MAG TPA: DUF1223 domain-containing protein, partial [Rhizomicrobium sp.]|nr:DUF1223 domain-containing protein [Rhizomicrobium sp.]